ncbi:enoyl-CoA hydratase/isomerase family protein [Sphingopyxis sp. Root214]|uniref:enoyl-CoA hydratase/isomerase family protein n=2 Tax=unclassified Sphingopyxis TaxID=2614943 RepID=UPI000AFA5EC9|nr:enoyl-CoA hydratase/isomerase family protein [Sphingopyxis sp. Root214]
MALVETAVHGEVSTLTLNDPDRRNPLSEALALSLRTAIAAAGRDPQVRCVLLTGKGDAFCAGGDLAALDTLSPAEVARFMAQSQAITQEIATLPVPVVVAINGAAAGAGFSLAVAGDVLLAAQSAVLIPAFRRVGAVPDLGLIHTLHRTIGLHRTTDILLRDKPIDAATALQLGLVSEVVPDTDLADRAMKVAEDLAAGPTVALGLTKKLIRVAATGASDAFLMAEASAQGIAFSTADFLEGVAAFRAQRRPRFKGK